MPADLVHSRVHSRGEASLYERVLAARDRLLTSPRFRDWAARFPLTRPIARRRARRLFDLCAGFVYSQVLLSCVRLGLFEALRDGPRTSAALAGRLSLSDDATDRLLQAALSLGLVSRRGRGRFGLGPMGTAMIDNPGIAEMVEHHEMLYADLSDPLALLRGDARMTALAGYWSYARSEDPHRLTSEQTAAYSSLMAASQPLVAREVLDAYPLPRHRCLLDVGGGDGSFLAAAAAQAPDLRLLLFDLPSVAVLAQRRFDESGLVSRAKTFGGDVFRDPLPAGADVVSLVRVIHDHDDASAGAILKAARRALPPGGTLLLAEPMSGTPGAEPAGAAYFGFYLLAMGSGRPRTPSQLLEMLKQSGFGAARLVNTNTPLLTRLIVATAE